MPPTLDQLVTNDGMTKTHSPSGGYWERSFLTELVTLNTGAVFTDTAANLLPANSLIEAVTARVTTTITTAVSWKLGDFNVSDRFTSANSTMTAGTTDVGFNHVEGTGLSGKIQVAAAKVRITLDANPGAGVVRVVVWYQRFVAPTA